jgi:hypothetical protein
VLGTGKCISHQPKDVQRSLGFGGKQPGSGRPRKPHAIEVLKERIEANVAAVLNPLFEALNATKPVVVSTGGNTSTAESYVEFVPDWPTRIAAGRELLDRGYGKSKSISETTVITRDSLQDIVEEMEKELAKNDKERVSA